VTTLDSAAGTPPSDVNTAGCAALLTLGSRMAGLYTVTVIVGIVAGSPSGGRLQCLAVAVIVALQGAQVVRALRHRPNTTAVAIATALFIAAVAATAWLVPVIGDSHAQFLIALIGCGLAAGAAASWGAPAGVLFTACYLITLIVAMSRVGHSVDPLRLSGTLTTVLVTATASVLLRRGFAVTERALASVDMATTARDVARTRWAAQRRQIRDVHDTVLSTLSLLAHGGTALDESELRAACGREAARLRGNLDVAPRASAPSTIGPAADLGEFERLRKKWLTRSLDVRVYGDAGVLSDLGQDAATALMGAIDECLENVRRHAGVGVCNLVATRTPELVCCVVIDEGSGFEANAVLADRMGLAESVHARLREVGGVAKVWSAPGAGTSVVLALPLTAEHGERARL
jgi:signal transduction histidine kinase